MMHATYARLVELEIELTFYPTGPSRADGTIDAVGLYAVSTRRFRGSLGGLLHGGMVDLLSSAPCATDLSAVTDELALCFEFQHRFGALVRIDKLRLIARSFFPWADGLPPVLGTYVFCPRKQALLSIVRRFSVGSLRRFA